MLAVERVSVQCFLSCELVWSVVQTSCWSCCVLGLEHVSNSVVLLCEGSETFSNPMIDFVPVGVGACFNMVLVLLCGACFNPVVV